MGRVTVRRPVLRIQSGSPHGSSRPDTLAAEEPLEIRVNSRALSVTMRTPGADLELAHGFLLTEGVISAKSDVALGRYCAGKDPDGRNTYNVLDIQLADGVHPPDPSVERNFYTTSSCGVCGKAALDAVKLKTHYPPDSDPVTLDSATLLALPDRLRESQRIFDRTGGLHAASLFTAEGELLVCREDVGRHNAVDKVLGWALLQERVPLTGTILQVSGRASFELVQKASMAGIPALTAVSAPSSLAVELAEELGITLAGFVRGTSMNVYTRTDRVVTEVI